MGMWPWAQITYQKDEISRLDRVVINLQSERNEFRRKRDEAVRRYEELAEQHVAVIFQKEELEIERDCLKVAALNSKDREIRLQARVAELEAAIGPDAKALMDIQTILTKRENERIQTPPQPAKPTEPLPANDRNMSVFDTTNWEVTAHEHRRDETTPHPCNPPPGDDSPPVVSKEAVNAD